MYPAKRLEYSTPSLASVTACTLLLMPLACPDPSLVMLCEHFLHGLYADSKLIPKSPSGEVFVDEEVFSVPTTTVESNVMLFISIDFAER